MATHYNEPVDVASSCLTEEGTVFGGEKNLIKGLENVIKLYAPEVIAVSTTCLAETIGEDIKAMVKRFIESHKDLGTTIISCPSPGYGGTSFEGWFAALYALLDDCPSDPTPHDGLNVIVGPISPADTRALRELLEICKLTYTLLPDIGDNLDAPYRPKYHRLPLEGTPYASVKKMAGSIATLELSLTVDDRLSPGKLLEDRYGVPLIRLPLPIGLKATDSLMSALKELGAKIDPKLRLLRGRLLDGMLDSHKYSAMGRAAIFGEPDLTLGLANLASENGIAPVICAIGTKNEKFLSLISKMDLLGNMTQKTLAIDGADFEDINDAVLKNDINLLVGSSDGRRLSERLGLPLVRCGFPVHDRVGGQRLRTMLYDGSLSLLDSMVNNLQARVEGTYRENIKATFFLSLPPEVTKPNLDQDLHPCFSAHSAKNYARLHLPVASKCNISCAYCLRKYDCVSESRPGVASIILTPKEALAKFIEVKEKLGNLSVVGIAGPGEALADFDTTIETLRLIRERDPIVLFCLSTNGLLLNQYLERLVEVGLSHLTVTVNAIDPIVGSKIYSYIDYQGSRYQGISGAALILANQLSGIKAAAKMGLNIKINSVLIDGLNNDQIPKIAEICAALGASLGNVIKHIPIEGTLLAQNPVVSNLEHQRVVRECQKYLSQMRHCRQCRADAAGLLGEDNITQECSLEASHEVACQVASDASHVASQEIAFDASHEVACDVASEVVCEVACQVGSDASQDVASHLASHLASDATRADSVLMTTLAGAASNPVAPLGTVKVAVVSRSGTVVDQHFGQAGRFLVYQSDGQENRLLEIKKLAGAYGCSRCSQRDIVESTTPPVETKGFIKKMVEAISDCDAVLAIRIGDSPRQMLAAKGVTSYTYCGSVDEGVRAIAQRLLSERGQTKLMAS
jgi:nitrogenase cofactor biosynthesis protein NifB